MSKPLRVVAFNGSPRENGNTSRLIEVVFKELNDAGIETKKFNLGTKPMHGCISCFECFKNKDFHCILKQDMGNQCIDEMLQADGIILASPTYCGDVTTNMKALIERTALVAKANNEMLQKKVGAAVIAERRSGAVHAFSSINLFYLTSQMIICGSNYWNTGKGLSEGEIENDFEGIETIKILGRNMAWLLKKINN